MPPRPIGPASGEIIGPQEPGEGGFKAPQTLDDLLTRYQAHCRRHGAPFSSNASVIAPDETTLFTTSGMQKHKTLFADASVRGRTLADCQTCFRSVDLMEVGDGSHSLDFRMLGLFSFRDWSLERGMSFWLGFCREIGVEPTRITVHPDKLAEHKALWERLGLGALVEPDPGCQWSDGAIGGYCTELYVGDLEVGNIVNPLGDCLDCGFGLERLGMALGIHRLPGAEQSLRGSCALLISQGVLPGANGRAYVLRKMLRRLWSLGSDWKDPVFERESRKFQAARERYRRLLGKHPGQSPQWWWQTHGIDVADQG